MTTPNGDLPAYPNPNSDAVGLSKRELIAAMVLQGAIASMRFEVYIPEGGMRLPTAELICGRAVEYADILLAELAKEAK